MGMKLDKSYMELNERMIQEKIKEQEIVFNSINDPDIRRLVDDRITTLKVELALYRRLMEE
jgi:hypothetical protein